MALAKSWLWISAKLPTAVTARFPQPVKASELKTVAAWDLLCLGPAAKDAVSSLVCALKDGDFLVRLDAFARLASTKRASVGSSHHRVGAGANAGGDAAAVKATPRRQADHRQRRKGETWFGAEC